MLLYDHGNHHPLSYRNLFTFRKVLQCIAYQNILPISKSLKENETRLSQRLMNVKNSLNLLSKSDVYSIYCK